MQAFVPILNWKNASKCIKIFLKNSLTVPERHQNRYLLCISFPQLGTRKVWGVRESKISQKLMILSFFPSFHVSCVLMLHTRLIKCLSLVLSSTKSSTDRRSNQIPVWLSFPPLPFLYYPDDYFCILPAVLLHLLFPLLSASFISFVFILAAVPVITPSAFFLLSSLPQYPSLLPLPASFRSTPPALPLPHLPAFLFFRPLIPNTLPCLYQPFSTMFSSCKHLLLLRQNLILIISPLFSLSPPPFPRLHQACSRSSGAGMTWLSGYGGQRRSLPCAPSLADPSKWTVKPCCCSLRRTSATVRLTQVSISFLLSSGRSTCLQLPLNSAAKISD